MAIDDSGTSPTVLGVLTDLDTLLDTRLGTIARHSTQNDTKHLATLLRNHVKYTDRLSDDFIPGIVDLSNFKELYQQRDKLTLAYSIATHMLDVIRILVSNLRMKEGMLPYEYTTKLYVNLHPYTLTDFEKEELLIVIREAMAKQYIETIFIDIPLEKLSVYDIRAKFHYIYLYHYEQVLDSISQKNEIKKVQMPDRTFIVPALIIGDSKKILEDHGAKLATLYEMLQKITEPFLKLEFIDAYYFSARIEPLEEAEPSATTP